MKIVDQSSPDRVVLELTGEELATLYSIAVEMYTGANALDDEDWDMYVGWPRTTAGRLIDELGPSVQRFTDTQ